ncbi:hypothetical protein P8452_52851 [Trifolium repens]|nr:hypothetical protein P8452_52851 [Trifolium repens]
MALIASNDAKSIYFVLIDSPANDVGNILAKTAVEFLTLDDLHSSLFFSCSIAISGSLFFSICIHRQSLSHHQRVACQSIKCLCSLFMVSSPTSISDSFQT